MQYLYTYITLEMLSSRNVCWTKSLEIPKGKSELGDRQYKDQNENGKRQTIVEKTIENTDTFRDLTNYGNDTRFLNCCKINTKKNDK